MSETKEAKAQPAGGLGGAQPSLAQPPRRIVRAKRGTGGQVASPTLQETLQAAVSDMKPHAPTGYQSLLAEWKKAEKTFLDSEYRRAPFLVPFAESFFSDNSHVSGACWPKHQRQPPANCLEMTLLIQSHVPGEAAGNIHAFHAAGGTRIVYLRDPQLWNASIETALARHWTVCGESSTREALAYERYVDRCRADVQALLPELAAVLPLPLVLTRIIVEYRAPLQRVPAPPGNKRSCCNEGIAPNCPIHGGGKDLVLF